MDEFAVSFTIFVLGVFVGFEVISKVPALLHTPLMAGSNAISGITLVGAFASAGAQLTVLTTVLAFIAVFSATLCVVGGYGQTHRMLRKFKRKA